MKFIKESNDNVAEVREVKKSLPYTVSNPYGSDLRDYFRKEQEAKEATWEAGRAERDAKNKARAIDIIVNGNAPKSYGDMVMDNYQYDQKRQLDRWKTMKTADIQDNESFRAHTFKASVSIANKIQKLKEDMKSKIVDFLISTKI